MSTSTPATGQPTILTTMQGAAFLLTLSCAGVAAAQNADANPKQLEDVVVTANRSEQRRFDTPASIDAVPVDPLRLGSPLVNMSELLSVVPGIQARERQNYAQDLQISVRGFGSRSTFGVRGVRILIDGIPATQPDGQGQAATASLTSAKRIEVLRGPVAQLYGNAAGGVVQVFTADPPTDGRVHLGASAGAGSYNQTQIEGSIAGGNDVIGGLLDVSQYATDGYRDHSAARRNQLNAKLVARPSSDTTLTGVFNVFDQPLAQDPLGLTRAQFDQNPRQVVQPALTFNTRKTIRQHQGGVVLEQRLSASDTINARVYAGTRQVFQTLALAANGVVDLDNSYGGAGLSWTRKTSVNGMPLNWTVGVESDRLDQERRGFNNVNGTPGAISRSELDKAQNTDFFGQLDWTFLPQWKASAGVRSSRVRLNIDDRLTPVNNGTVDYRNTSPVLGLVWYAREDLNFYGNIGRGFETPTLAESAYRSTATASPGPNLSLRASRSLQGEIGAKYRSGRHVADLALFDATSQDEIVPLSTLNGRTVYQNVDEVKRRGLELSLQSGWGQVSTRVAYTYLDAQFGKAYVNVQNGAVAAGNRLPGVPAHSLSTQVEFKPTQQATVGAEMRLDSKVYVNDINSEAAPGYAIFNLRGAYEFRAGPSRMFLYGRLDNVFDRQYAGSVIVNDGNRRFYEPAAGRRLFVGLRTQF
ncbi:iron complex outermembrane recepter protein [Noviherbaspirillum humi]|uniref:Iron complex outermembrane recepter protein n=1 Tax=Noviherbaspirillum humi TaxID=1688639 RepID=A0A239E8C4_9BURK|nr:TonB-dependent receptor [Noviherbaspirillum humi]SNS40253.1 iron complex outermembrane recepter protein [Noviherbaspirillum humi]